MASPDVKNPLNGTASSAQRALNKVVELLNPDTNYVATANRILEVNSGGKMSGSDIIKPSTAGGAYDVNMLPNGNASIGTPSKFYLDHIHPARYTMSDDVASGDKLLELYKIQFVTTSTGTSLLTLPEPTKGDWLIVKYVATGGTIELVPNPGAQIDGAGADVHVDISLRNVALLLVANNNLTWYII